MPIHSTAIVDPRARIDPAAEIGPFVVVDGPVQVGAGTRVLARAYLGGATVIGRDNVIHVGAVIGHEPQVLGFAGEETPLRIGDRNVFREQCEVHRASKADGATVIGDDNFLMSHCHVVHQFVRIGRLALLRGLSRTSRDVPPFCVMDGTHTVRALNRIGLRRAGLDGVQIRALQRAFARLFGQRQNLQTALAEIEAEPMSDEVRHLVEFVRASRRGVCSGPGRDRTDPSDPTDSPDE